MEIGSPGRPRRPLTSREAAAELGVCERTLRRYIATERLRHHRLPGGHFRIPAEAIDEFWATNEKASAQAPVPAAASGGDAGQPVAARRPAARRRPPLGREQPHGYDLSPEHLAELRARVAADLSR